MMVADYTPLHSAVNESLQPDNSTAFDATIYAQSNDQQVMALRFGREEA